jgi:FtsZ-binding cell division protein ZapB
LKQNSDSTNYIAEIEDLKKKNAMLSQDVRAKTQKVVELEFRLDKMKKQLNEYSEENDKISLIINVQSMFCYFTLRQVFS